MVIAKMVEQSQELWENVLAFVRLDLQALTAKQLYFAQQDQMVKHVRMVAHTVELQETAYVYVLLVIADDSVKMPKHVLQEPMVKSA
jgi:hypothetical protein